MRKKNIAWTNSTLKVRLISKLAKTEIIYPKNVRAQEAMDFT